MRDETSVFISVPILNDTDVESTETFKLKLFLATFDRNLAGDIINVVETSELGEATGTILDEEGRTISIAQSSYQVGEGDGTARIVVNSSVIAGLPIELTYRVLNGTATVGDGDFVDVSSTSSPVAIARGSNRAVINVGILDDSEEEVDENFVVEVTGYTIGENTTTASLRTTITIKDNDTVTPTESVISITSTSGSGTEGGTITYDFTLAPASDGSVEIAFSGTAGTAISGTDYTFATASPLTFTDTATTGSLVVNLAADGLDEPEENFTLTLTDI